MFEKQRNLNLQQRGCLDHDKIILCHSSCVMRFICLKNIYAAIFSNKISIRA